MPSNKQWHLVSRPNGEPTLENFKLVETEVPSPSEGQFLIRAHYMSLDPYMRGRMDDKKSYTKPQVLNEVMLGGVVGEIVTSNNKDFSVGEYVSAFTGWQEYGLSDGTGVRKVDPKSVPLQAYLGTVGMPGATAWWGLNKIIEPKESDTIVVSAASGAVGSVVGQLAKLKGCHVVGIAGGPQKCAAVVDEFGFDACVDYKSPTFEADLEAAVPKGIDGYFDNVGGVVLDAVLARMNAFGRIATCGLISGYNGNAIAIHNTRSILVNRLKMQGFIVSDHPEAFTAGLAELGPLVASGKLKYRETVSQGIEAAPRAFIGLLKGENFGKQLVKLV